MTNILESFFVALGFQVDTAGIDEMKKKTEELRDSAVKLGGLFAAAAGGIGLFVTKIAGALDDLGDFAERENVAVEMVQELGHAAQLNGSSVDQLKASISGVNRVVGEAALGIGRGAMTFKKLGMSAKNADGSVKSFDDILSEVADRMEGLSRQEQIAMAEKLGIDRSLIPLLRKGSAEIRKLREEAQAFGVSSAEDVEKASKLADAMDRTKFMVAALTKTVAVGLMPQVTAVLDGFRNWLLVNKQLVRDSIDRALQFTAGVIEFVWDWAVRLGDAVASLVRWLFEFKVVVYLAAAALTVFAAIQVYEFMTKVGGALRLLTMRMLAFNAAALIVPAIIGAIAIAIGLLVDDYVNWKEGNDSVIGELAESFPWLLGAIKAVEDGVGRFVDFWLEQWRLIGPPLGELGQSLWNLVSVVVDLLWPVIKMVFTGWAYIAAAVLPVLAQIVQWLAERLVDAVLGVVLVAKGLADAFTWVFNGIKTGIDLVVQAFDFAKGKVSGFIDSVTGAISKVGSLLGLTDKNSGVKLAVSQGITGAETASANNSLNASGGVIGQAGSTQNSSTVTSTTTISGTNININSPDPAKAGEAVKQELDKMNKQTVRNGQTAVAL